MTRITGIVIFSEMTEGQVILDEVWVSHGVEGAPVLPIGDGVKVVGVCPTSYWTERDPKLRLRFNDLNLVCITNISEQNIVNSNVGFIRVSLVMSFLSRVST